MRMIRCRVRGGTAWGDWLTAQSGAMASPPAMGTAPGDAPGSYVHQR